ncbi:hypothetical protein MMC31_007754, partial [Peltigera leucophlebia]|nr:hypothetical protein [Peltigera leucophlebia]
MTIFQQLQQLLPVSPSLDRPSPDANHTANSVTGTLENVIPRMKKELQDCQVLDLPLDDFLKRFITLEDAQ